MQINNQEVENPQACINVLLKMIEVLEDSLIGEGIDPEELYSSSSGYIYSGIPFKSPTEPAGEFK